VQLVAIGEVKTECYLFGMDAWTCRDEGNGMADSVAKEGSLCNQLKAGIDMKSAVNQLQQFAVL